MSPSPPSNPTNDMFKTTGDGRRIAVGRNGVALEDDRRLDGGEVDGLRLGGTRRRCRQHKKQAGQCSRATAVSHRGLSHGDSAA